VYFDYDAYEGMKVSTRSLKLDLCINAFSTLLDQLTNVLIAIHFTERACKLAELLRIKFELEVAIDAMLATGISAFELFTGIESSAEYHITAIYNCPEAHEAVTRLLNPLNSSSQAPA
jgi:hypothetical protein